jgi:hypothetical protein
VGILSTLIRELSLETAAKVSLTSIDKVVVSVPLLPALTREDLNDAIEYAGLSHWLDGKVVSPWIIPSGRAVMAGNGYHLCVDYKNLYNCKDESFHMPRENVFAVR